MKRSSLRAPAACLVVLAATSLLASCSDDDSAPPAPPAPVELDADGAPDDLSIGVIVSLTSAPGEGSQWSAAAEGAEVAAYRYGLGDLSVTLHAVDDKGDAEGAADAVSQLVEQDVAGIVVATSGPHVQGALDAAQSAGVPVLLPYDTETTDLPETAWRLGPDSGTVASVLSEALSQGGLEAPVVGDAGGGTPDGVDPVLSLPFAAGGNADRIARKVVRQIKSDQPADSVLVSGPAPLQAEVVGALQGADVTLPVVLTPDALSPQFATDLAKAGGTLAGSFVTAGVDAGDTAAMSSGGRGQALSAYFAGLRAAATDADVSDFFDNEPFATVAAAADTRSHDAVVALVRAAAEAGSADPADVLAALSDLTLGHEDGLAGPALDFTSHDAVAPDDVTVLNASSQGPGVRPASATESAEPQLFWFAAPEG